MKFCPECGFKLSTGKEKFCPDCGFNFQQLILDSGSTNINNTKGDVFGTGISGSGNFIGKEIGYTVQGNVINLQISGGTVSQEVLNTLQRIVAIPIQVEQTHDRNKVLTEDIKTKVQESGTAHQQIQTILNEVNRIEKNTGTDVQEIRAGDLQISKSKLSIKAIILQGNKHYYKNEYNEAIKCYDKALAIEPKNATVWNNKGLSLSKIGKYNEALACYDKAIESNPDDFKTFQRKKETLLKIGKFDQAEKVGKESVSSLVDLAHNVGITGKGKSNEAVKEYDKAIEIDPLSPVPWIRKGLFLRLQNKNNEALKCYDKAIEIDPNSDYVWREKADFLDILKKPEEALKCYDKALEIDPNYDWSWIRKGRILEELRSHEGAIECYDKALEINSTNRTDAWADKGLALYNLGRYEEALKCYDKAIEIDPKHINALYSKGNILYYLGKYNEAIENYDKALEISPKFALALNSKRSALDKLGKHEGFFKRFRKQ